MVECEDEDGECRMGKEGGGESICRFKGETILTEWWVVSLKPSGTGPGRSSLLSQILPKAITRRTKAVSGDLSIWVLTVVEPCVRLEFSKAI